MRIWRLGSRGSQLALTQSRMVAADFERLTGDRVEVVIIRTRGDAIHDKALRDVGGKGLFTKEIEDAMLAGEVDFAVHSMKDMPTTSPEGLVIAGIPKREDPRDALIGTPFGSLAQGAIVGTGSARRSAQLHLARPDLELRGIRGNVDTRIRKQCEGDYDAVVLACAGLNRLGLDVQRHPLSLDVLIPAVGQGALAVQCRASDAALCAHLQALSDPETADAVALERAYLIAIDGGCSIPAGCYARAEGDMLDVRAFLAADDGSHTTQTRRVPRAHAVEEGRALGLAMRAQLTR